MNNGWTIVYGWRIAAGIASGWGVWTFLQDQLKPDDQVRALEMLAKARLFAFKYPAQTIALLIGVFIFYRTWRRGAGAFSILAAEIDMEFEDCRGDRVKIVRNQLLRTQRPGVTISLTKAQAHRGKVEIDEPNWSATLAGDAPPPKLLVWSRGASVEALHRFETEIPFPSYAPLVPDWLLGLFIRGATSIPAHMPNFLQRLILHRQQVTFYVNEFNHENAYQEFSAGKSYHRRVSITLKLPDRIPVADLAFSAFKIFGTGAKDVPFARTNNKFRIETHLAPEEILRLTWSRKCTKCDNRVPKVGSSLCSEHAGRYPAVAAS